MTTPESAGSAVELAWKRYRAWAKTARKLKSAHERAYLWVGVLALVGAIAGIMAQQVVPPERLGPAASWLNKGIAVVSAIAVAVSAYLARQLLGVERETQWVRARSIAEAFKSQLYLFWTRAEPYEEPGPAGAASPQKRLLEKIGELDGTGAQLPREEPSKEELGTPPAESMMTIDDYVRLRIKDQIQYYRTQATNHQATLRRYQAVGFVLGLVGTLLGVFGATEFGAKTVAWVAVVSTAAMALAGFASSGRHPYLVTSYRAAGDRLELLLAEWSSTQKTQADHHKLIVECEATLRAENSSWLVERTKPVPTQPAAKPPAGPPS